MVIVSIGEDIDSEDTWNFANVVTSGRLANVMRALDDGVITKKTLGWKVGDSVDVPLTENGVTTNYTWVVMDTAPEELYTNYSEPKERVYARGDSGDSDLHYMIGLKKYFDTRRSMSASRPYPSYGWKDCEMRTFCNGTLKDALPSYLTSALKLVNIKTKYDSTYSTDGKPQNDVYVNTLDYLFLPSHNEFFGWYGSTDFHKTRSNRLDNGMDVWLRDASGKYQFMLVTRSSNGNTDSTGYDFCNALHYFKVMGAI